MIETRWTIHDRAARACAGTSPPLCAIGSGYDSTPSTSTTVQQPYSTNLANAVVNTAGYDLTNPSTWPQWFPGSTVSPFTPAQTAGIGTLEADAANPAPATTSALGFANNLESGNYINNNSGSAALAPFASGAYTDPSSNPYFSQTLGTLTGQVVPNIVSQFVAGGDMNNPAMAYATSQGATNAMAPYLSQLYSTGLQNQLAAGQSLGSLYNQGVATGAQGLALAPQTAQLPFAAPTEEYQAGSLEQNQALLNSQVQQWNYNQTLGQNMVNWAAGINAGAPGGTTSMTTPMYYSPVSNALGIGNSIFGGGSDSLYSGLIGAFGL